MGFFQLFIWYKESFAPYYTLKPHQTISLHCDPQQVVVESWPSLVATSLAPDIPMHTRGIRYVSGTSIQNQAQELKSLSTKWT